MAHKRKGKKYIYLYLILAGLISLLVLMLAYCWYAVFYAPAGRHDKTVYIFVGKYTKIADVKEQLHTKLWAYHPRILNLMIDYQRLGEHLHQGRYAIPQGTTIRELIKMLSSGKQTPVNISLRGVRSEEELIEAFSKHLLLSRADIAQAMTDSVLLRREGLDRESMRSLFFAEEYTLFWNTTAKDLMDSVLSKHNTFWSDARRAKADRLGITTAEVSTLASIVQSESAKPQEYGSIARLYLNRHSKGMLLQSDPTVKFALGDFSLRRILYGHLSVESPYNTYRTKGLPPGPICLPKTSIIDAVLNAPKHNYIYMCAKEDFSGYHNFAEDYITHRSNARRYQEALNQRGIK